MEMWFIDCSYNRITHFSAASVCLVHTEDCRIKMEERPGNKAENFPGLHKPVIWFLHLVDNVICYLGNI